MSALQEGRQLWWVGAHRTNKGPADVTVIKVGRKWVQLNNGYRIDRETMRADGAGYASPGRCWNSQAEWEAEEARQKLWEKFVGKLPRYQAPDGLGVDRIERAAAALGISLADT